MKTEIDCKKEIFHESYSGRAGNADGEMPASIWKWKCALREILCAAVSVA
jgi:hypothetical protein